MPELLDVLDSTGNYTGKIVDRVTAHAEGLGLELTEHDPLFIGCSTSTQDLGNIKNNHFNEYYVLERELSPSTLTLQPGEVDEVRWFDRADLVSRIQNNYDGITDKVGCWSYLLRYLGVTQNL